MKNRHMRPKEMEAFYNAIVNKACIRLYEMFLDSGFKRRDLCEGTFLNEKTIDQIHKIGRKKAETRPNFYSLYMLLLYYFDRKAGGDREKIKEQFRELCEFMIENVF